MYTTINKIKSPIRLNIFKSNKHIYLQAIDTKNNLILVSASTVENKFQNLNFERVEHKLVYLINLFVLRLKKIGISKLILTNKKYKYHGKVKLIINLLLSLKIRLI